MTPSLLGRLQTRVLLVLIVGVPWTLILTPFLPRPGAGPDRPSLAMMYEGTFRTLMLVLLFGLGWEVVYHGLQQFRWEKDWPSLFGLLTGINEGLLVWFVLDLGLFGSQGSVPGPTFLIHFISTWLLIWFFAQGPMRVVSLRWRFHGGRVL